MWIDVGSIAMCRVCRLGPFGHSSIEEGNLGKQAQKRLTVRVFARNELENNSVRFGSRFGGVQVSFQRQRTKLSPWSFLGSFTLPNIVTDKIEANHNKNKQIW